MAGEVSLAARNARLRCLKSKPAMELNHDLTLVVHLLRRRLLRHGLWKHGSECLLILRGNWVSLKAASVEEFCVMGLNLGLKREWGFNHTSAR